MKTVKEYANSVGKSHQSVYKQLNSKKNKERLESHVWKQDGTTYLDDVAIDILNESRQMIQIQNDIQAHEDNDNLRKEVDDLKNKIINLQDELKVKTEQMTSLLLENKEKTFLLEQKKDHEEQLDREKKEQLNEIEKLKNELEKEKQRSENFKIIGKLYQCMYLHLMDRIIPSVIQKFKIVKLIRNGLDNLFIGVLDEYQNKSKNPDIYTQLFDDNTDLNNSYPNIDQEFANIPDVDELIEISELDREKDHDHCR